MTIKPEKSTNDFWSEHKIGSRLAFIIVLIVFLVMSIKILNGQIIDKNFQDIIANLILYLTIFIGLGANSVEKISNIYEKISINKLKNNKKDK